MNAQRFELIRKGWHMAAGVAAAPIVYYTSLGYATVVALAAAFFVVALEFLRLFFGINVPFFSAQLARVRRSGENFSWASIGFLLVLVALFWLTPSPVAVAAAAMLAFGDTMSSVAGRAFGRTKIPWNPRKSVVGSLTGMTAAFVGAWLVVLWWESVTGLGMGGTRGIIILVVGAAAAMVAESLPDLEDNVTMPGFAGATMFAAWNALGLSPAVGPIVGVVRGLIV